MLWFKKGFKLRVSQSWFSSDYVQFEYTTNGWYWRTIKTCDHPFLDEENYGMKTLTTPLDEYGIDFWKRRFSRLEDIESYEREQRKIGIEGNEKLREQRKRRIESKRDILRKANE